jgi:hypothetical protein
MLLLSQSGACCGNGASLVQICGSTSFYLWSDIPTVPWSVGLDVILFILCFVACRVMTASIFVCPFMVY